MSPSLAAPTFGVLRGIRRQVDRRLTARPDLISRAHPRNDPAFMTQNCCLYVLAFTMGLGTFFHAPGCLNTKMVPPEP